MHFRKRRSGRIGRNPHWITLKYAGNCSACSTALKRGSEGFYYPNDRTLYGKDCCEAAGNAERDFQARDFDDQMNAAQFGPAGPPT